MAFSSGTFSRLYDWTDDRDAGVKIRADRMDDEMDGMATGLSTCLLKDGTQTATARIPFAAGISVAAGQTAQIDTIVEVTAAAGVLVDSVKLKDGGVQIQDTDQSHYLAIAAGSNLTADRIFTLTTGDSERTLDISAADVTISSFGATLTDDADQSTAQTTLGLVPGTDVQAYDAGLADIAGLAVTDGNIIVGDGANWVAESGATARASIGAGTGDGDVSGPASSTDNALTRFNGTGGKTIQNSGATLDDNDNLTIPANAGVHLTEGTAPSTAVSTGALYTKDTSGQPELFYREESDGDEVQLTSGGNVYRQPDFVSSEQTVTADTLLTVAHGLGAIPSLVIVSLRCKTADLNYSVGDEILFQYSAQSATDDGVTVAADATNIELTQSAVFRLIDQSSFNSANITVGNWKWVVRCWI